MDFDIFKASDELSKLDIKLYLENIEIDVLWFRVMQKIGSWVITRHRHSSFEFHFVASGGSKVILDDGEFDVYAGDFYITIPGVYHKQINNECSEYIEYSLNCDISTVNNKITEDLHLYSALTHSRCIPCSNIEPILKLFNSALEEALYKKMGFYNKIKNIVMDIMIESIRSLGTFTEFEYEAPMKYKNYDFRFLKIKRYILDNINTNMSVKEIADYLHLSEKQTSRIVSKYEGKSIKEFIIKLKLQKSKELLIDTEYTINQISEMLGFSSQYYFSQFFKSHISQSPSKFRMEQQNVQKS